MHDAEEMKWLDADLALIAQQLKEDHQHAAQQLRQNVGQLLRTIETQAQGVIARAAEQAVRQCSAQLQDSAQKADWAAQALADQRKLLTKAQQSTVYLNLAALLVGTVLAAGGSSYLVWKNMRELKRAEFGADILRATQSGSLTRCGEALCVKVGQHAKPYGKSREYFLLEE